MRAQNRILPLTTLGVGHYAAIDKAMALRHAIALETGFDRNGLARHCDSVRVTLPDSGTEHLINDVPDIIDIFLAGQCNPGEVNKLGGTILFKYSIWVPDVSGVYLAVYLG